MKGLKFGDHQNQINNAISIGVCEDVPNPELFHNVPNPVIPTNAIPELLHNVPNPATPTNAIQHDILIDNENEQDNEDDDGPLDDSVPLDDNADGVHEVSEADEPIPSDGVEQPSDDTGR